MLLLSAQICKPMLLLLAQDMLTEIVTVGSGYVNRCCYCWLRICKPMLLLSAQICRPMLLLLAQICKPKLLLSAQDMLTEVVTVGSGYVNRCCYCWLRIC